MIQSSYDFRRISEHEIGKAAEHIVAADLLLRGYRATIASAGLPYDLIVDDDGVVVKVQVKTTTKVLKRKGNYHDVYRFSLRRSVGGRRRLDSRNIDCLAVVALDIMKIGYVPVSELLLPNGTLKIVIEMKSREHQYAGRVYSNGTERRAYGRFIEDYQAFFYG